MPSSFTDFSHRFYKSGQYKIARLINYWARVLTGSDIHPGATTARASSLITP
jgi:serine O-acetyltransferase